MTSLLNVGFQLLVTLILIAYVWVGPGADEPQTQGMIITAIIAVWLKEASAMGRTAQTTADARKIEAETLQAATTRNGKDAPSDPAA